MSRPLAIRTLASMIALSFSRARLPSDVIANPRINYPDLPWQLPPLRSELVWQGAQLQSFLTPVLDVTADGLYTFWVNNLKSLELTPNTTIGKLRRGGIGYTSMYKMCGRSQTGERRFAFSIPDGFPRNMDEYSGVLFSLEAAEVAVGSLPLSGIVDDEDNYYVTLHENGKQIGVKDGRPLVGKEWAADASGLVQDILRVPRGQVSVTCSYDTISLARSLLHEHKKYFGKDAVPMEAALQILRVLTVDQHCPELVRVVAELPARTEDVKSKVQALLYCRDVLQSDMPDRNKLSVLHEQLVGTVINHTTFKREIFSSEHYPVLLAKPRYDKIVDWVASKLTEINYAEQET